MIIYSGWMRSSVWREKVLQPDRENEKLETGENRDQEGGESISGEGPVDRMNWGQAGGCWIAFWDCEWMFPVNHSSSSLSFSFSFSSSSSFSPSPWATSTIRTSSPAWRGVIRITTELSALSDTASSMSWTADRRMSVRRCLGEGGGTGTWGDKAVSDQPLSQRTPTYQLLTPISAPPQLSLLAAPAGVAVSC